MGKLDFNNWALCEYQNTREAVEKQGYGIISYTWGLYRDGTNSVDRKLSSAQCRFGCPETQTDGQQQKPQHYLGVYDRRSQDNAPQICLVGLDVRSSEPKKF